MRKLASFMGLMLLILTTSIFTSCKPEPKPEPKVYTVTFDAAGGSEVAAIKVKSGEKAVQPEDPTKEGYVFDAWYNGEAKYDWETPVTADITLTAKWTDKVYTVTFDAVGGSEVAAIQVKSGEKAVQPEDPTKEGCVFAGWLNGETAYDFELPVTSDLVLTAKWDVAKYLITFDVAGVEKIVVETGKTAEKQKPADPTKEGYTFAGWLNGEEAYDWTKPVTADVVLKASWAVIEYKINYVLPERVTTDNPATYTIETEVITLKDAKVPEGKYFGGWFIDKEYKTAATSIEKGSTGDKTFYAKLNDNPTFTLTLKDGEKEYASLKVEEGKVATKPEADPTKDGYTFKGWMNGETAYNWKSEVTADLTLIASWDINKYTVTIDGVAQTVEHGKVLTEPDAPAAVAGKEFKGWYNGEKPYDWTKPVTSDLELKVKWDVVKYKITFDVEGVKAIEVEYGKTAEKPADPTKDGYTFKGWMNGDAAYDWTAEVKSNLTLTASWEINEYTVTFDSDGGSEVAAAKVKYKETVKEPTAPTKVGFNFDGWYNGDTKFDFTTKITKDLTLKAQWKAEVVEPEVSAMDKIFEVDKIYRGTVTYTMEKNPYYENAKAQDLYFNIKTDSLQLKKGDKFDISFTLKKCDSTINAIQYQSALDAYGTYPQIQLKGLDKEYKVSFTVGDITEFDSNLIGFKLELHTGENDFALVGKDVIVEFDNFTVKYVPYVAGEVVNEVLVNEKFQNYVTQIKVSKLQEILDSSTGDAEIVFTYKITDAKTLTKDWEWVAKFLVWPYDEEGTTELWPDAAELDGDGLFFDTQSDLANLDISKTLTKSFKLSDFIPCFKGYHTISFIIFGPAEFSKAEIVYTKK